MEERINPQFCDLLDLLRKEITSNGVSLQVAEDLKEANQRLSQTKCVYFQNKMILDELKNILTNYHSCPKDNQNSAREDQVHQMLQDALSMSQAKHHLRISQKPDKESCNLFGLSEDQLNDDKVKKRETRQILQQYFTSDIEQRLKKKCIHIIRFWDSKAEEESDGLALAKATKLPFSIESEIDKIEEEKEALKMQKIENQKLLKKYYEEICCSVKDLEDSIGAQRLNANMNNTKVTVDWLAAKCDAMQRKIRVLKCQLLKDTYSKETVAALHQIRNLLDKAMHESKIELRKIKETLQVYESVGPGFESLVKQYVNLTAEIDNKKWALSELKRTQGLDNGH